MKLLSLIFLSLSLSSFAQADGYECVIKKPCAQSYTCIGDVTIEPADNRNYPEQTTHVMTIKDQQGNVLADVALAKLEKFMVASERNKSWNEGYIWVKLLPIGDGQYEGIIEVKQFVEFEVSCTKI